MDNKDHSRDYRHNLYIFGHSLDISDRDILREFILHDNVDTTIFYYEKIDENGVSDNGRTELGKKIANLVKVIGQEELIKRTGGSTKTIDFRLQQNIWVKIHTIPSRVYFYLNVYHTMCHGIGAIC